MHFLLTTLKVVYVLTTPMPELLEDATVEAIRIRIKWENDDYICRDHILNGSTTLMTLKWMITVMKGCKSSDGMMDCEEDQKGRELCEDIVDDSSEIEEDSDCVTVLDETCKEDVCLGSHIVVALIDVSSFSPIGIALVCENKGIDAAINDLDDYKFSECIHDGDDILNQPKITCVDRRVNNVLSPRHSKTTNLDNIKRGADLRGFTGGNGVHEEDRWSRKKE
nr:zinc finger, CCHC-type [Tanacetum cinerariifolium]